MQSRLQNVPEAPNPPASPAAPAPPTVPLQPVVAVAARLVPSRRGEQPGKPIIRIAGSQQELTQPVKSVPVLVSDQEPTPQEEAPPPRASGLDDTGPRPVQRPMPTLPTDAPSGFSRASVRVLVMVDEDGQVSDARIAASSGSPLLDSAALDCVREWEYDPAIRNGQSVSATVTEQVKFVSR